MFEKFTDKAIKVMMLTQEESRRLGHNVVSTEHILLGLIGEKTEIASQVLMRMGVSRDKARIEVERIVGKGSESPVMLEIPFTSEAKRVLELALQETRQHQHNYIDVGHILLGLIKEEKGLAVMVLKNLGVNISEVYRQVHNSLDSAYDTTANDAPASYYKSKLFLRNKSFQSFSIPAIKVIWLAEMESQRLGHNFIGTEQILLGLIEEGIGVAAQILKSLGVNLHDVRVEIEKKIGRGSGEVQGEIFFTPAAERLIEYSLEEARQLNSGEVNTEHLLLGLVRMQGK